MYCIKVDGNVNENGRLSFLDGTGSHSQASLWHESAILYSLSFFFFVDKFSLLFTSIGGYLQLRRFDYGDDRG